MKLIAHRDGGFIETTCDECGRVVIVKADDDVPLTLCPPCGGGCVCAAYEDRAPLRYGIMHPSDRALGFDLAGDEEVWGAADERLILFDTEAAASQLLADRIRSYPKSDWRHARVVGYRPGEPKVYSTWVELPAPKAKA